MRIFSFTLYCKIIAERCHTQPICLHYCWN